jgi:hypothetical protein
VKARGVSARIQVHRPSRRGWWLVVSLAAVGLSAFSVVFALGVLAPDGAMSDDAMSVGAEGTLPSMAPDPAALPLSPARADVSPMDWRRLSRQVARLQLEVEALERQRADRPGARGAAEGATSVPPPTASPINEAEGAGLGEQAAARGMSIVPTGQPGGGSVLYRER